MKIDAKLTPQKLQKKVDRVFDLAGQKIRLVDKSWDSSKGTPVFTVKGKYSSKGWTEWTQGFQFGMQFLQYDATGEEAYLALGREKTLKHMASHVSHIGVHDHGFNNVSTYGKLVILLGMVVGDDMLMDHFGYQEPYIPMAAKQFFDNAIGETKIFR